MYYRILEAVLIGVIAVLSFVLLNFVFARVVG